MTTLHRLQEEQDSRTPDKPQVQSRLLQSQTPRVARRRRPQRKKHWYAIKASEGEVILPKLKPLGYFSQSRLIQHAQDGDLEARNIVWLHNARLAYSVANRVRVPRDDVADVIQETQLALSRSIDRFDVDRLLVLSTYAFTAMCREARRFRYRMACIVSMPSSVHRDYAEFRHERSRIRTRADWFDLRTRYLDRDPKLYERMIRLAAFEDPVDVASARERPADGPPPESRLEQTETLSVLQKSITDLDNREREVLCRRHGLEGRPEETLEEIGRDFGLTKERIRQIQLRAERKLGEIVARRLGEPDPVPTAGAENESS